MKKLNNLPINNFIYKRYLQIKNSYLGYLRYGNTKGLVYFVFNKDKLLVNNQKSLIRQWFLVDWVIFLLDYLIFSFWNSSCKMGNFNIGNIINHTIKDIVNIVIIRHIITSVIIYQKD